ncbi:MAG: CHAT domain-containing protein [Acidobacteriota bacterium]
MLKLAAVIASSYESLGQALRTSLSFRFHDRKFATARLVVLTVAIASRALCAITPEIGAYVEAWKLYGRGEPEAAGQQLRQLIEAHPNFLQPHLLFANLGDQPGRFYEAEQYLLEQSRTKPRAAIFAALGSLYNLQQDYKAAEVNLKTCISREDVVPWCYGALAVILSYKRGGRAPLEDYTGGSRTNPHYRCLGIYHYYRIKQAIPRMLQAASDCLDSLKASGDREGELSLLQYLRGQHSVTGGYYKLSLQHLRRDRELAIELGDYPERLNAQCGEPYVLAKLGYESKAREVVGECEQIARSLQHRPFLKVILKETANLEMNLGDYERAAQLLFEVREIEIQEKRMYDAAVTARYAGKALLAAGRPSEAKASLEMALAELRPLSSRSGRSDLAWTLQYLSRAHLEFGDDFHALRFATEAVLIHRQMGAGWAAGMAELDLADIYQVLGDYPSAIRHVELALQSARKRFDRVEEQRALARLGHIYVKTERYREALIPLEKAVLLNKHTNMVSNYASSLIALGYACSELGMFEKATKYFQSALGLAERYRLGQVEVDAHYRLGVNLIRRRDLAGARTHLRRALEFAEQRDASGHVSRSLWQLARVERLGGNLEAALPLVERAIAVVELHRNQVPSPELKTSFLEQNSSIYEEAVLILAKMNDREPERYAGRALVYAERSRARSLLDQLEEPRWKFLSRLSAEQRRSLGIAEASWSNAVSTYTKSGTEDGRKAAENAEQALRALWTSLRLTDGLAHGSTAGVFDLSILDGTTAIEPATAVLEYALGTEQSHLWVISSGRVRMFRLPPRRSIDAMVRNYRERIRHHPSGAAAEDYQEQSARLYRVLLHPAESAIAGKKSLIISPEGALHHLPFESLIDNSVGAEFLIERYTVSYTPSLQVMSRLERRGISAAVRDLLAYGDPDYGNIASATASVPLVRSVYEKAGFRLPRLPSTREEVSAIAELYGRTNTDVRIGPYATESSLKSLVLSSFRRLHFAAHSALDERSPNRTGVVLSLTDAASKEDGVLRVEEIAGLHLDAEIVTLSACQTGLGPVIRGEGVIGLSQAFMQAGARRVVVSLWEVNDLTVPGFMVTFYRQSLAGKTFSDALRDAKLSMIRSNTLAYRHPYFWAPFVLNGIR